MNKPTFTISRPRTLRSSTRPVHYLTARSPAWDSPVGDIDTRKWQAVIFCVTVGVLSTMWMSHYFFPHGACVVKVLVGLCAGTTFGVMLAAAWPFFSLRWRSQASAWLRVSSAAIWTLFAMSSISWLLSELRSQERQLGIFRSLTDYAIASISIEVEGSRVKNVQDVEQVGSFAKIARQAELSFSRRAESSKKVRLLVRRSDGGSLAYEGHVLANRPDDLSLHLGSDLVSSELILPGARKWFDHLAAPYGDSTSISISRSPAEYVKRALPPPNVTGKQGR